MKIKSLIVFCLILFTNPANIFSSEINISKCESILNQKYGLDSNQECKFTNLQLISPTQEQFERTEVIDFANENNFYDKKLAYIYYTEPLNPIIIQYDSYIETEKEYWFYPTKDKSTVHEPIIKTKRKIINNELVEHQAVIIIEKYLYGVLCSQENIKQPKPFTILKKPDKNDLKA